MTYIPSTITGIAENDSMNSARVYDERGGYEEEGEDSHRVLSYVPSWSDSHGKCICV